MAIARVQTNWGDTGGTFATTVAATWGSTTVAGRLLVAIVCARSTGTNVPTFTAPAGWTAAPPSRQGGTLGSNQDPSCQIWYIKNASARSGSESFTISASTEAELYLLEYSGVDATAPYDTEGNASAGIVTNAGTGVTAGLAASNSLCIAAVAAKNQLRTFSTPQNGYTLVRQDVTSDATNANGIAVGLLEKIGGTAGVTETTGATINTGAQNTGVLSIFKPASGAATVTGAAALSGSGTLSASGVRTRLGASALAGAGILSASGVRTRFAAAVLSGAGSLTASGVRARFGAATLAGTGTLAATGVRTRYAAAGLSGAGALTAAGVRARFAVAALSGSGALVASGVRSTFGVVTLAGTGTLSATAEEAEIAVAVHVIIGDAPATKVDIADASTLDVQLGARPAITAVVSDQAALMVVLGDEPAPDVTTGDGP